MCIVFQETGRLQMSFAEIDMATAKSKTKLMVRFLEMTRLACVQRPPAVASGTGKDSDKDKDGVEQSTIVRVRLLLFGLRFSFVHFCLFVFCCNFRHIFRWPLNVCM